MIRHIVLWKFRDEAEGHSKQENMAAIKASLLALKPIIPELLSMEIGEDLGIGRDPFDMALVTTFADADALAVYQHHPAHKAVSAFVSKVRTDRASADFIL